MSSRILVALFVTGAMLCTTAIGEDVAADDLVVVRTDSALKVDEKTVEAVRRGQELVVERKTGGTLWVNSGAAAGWIEADDVERSPKKGKDVAFTINYRVLPKASTKLVTMNMHVPRTIPGRQTIRRVTFSVPPAKQFQKNGNAYAIFVLDKLDSPVDIAIKVEARIYRFDLTTAADDSYVTTIDQKARDQWLAQELRLEKDAPEIQAAAANIEEDDDAVETARNIMTFVQETLSESEYLVEQMGALWALKEKRGDCTEFSDLFVALCRAKGIPARSCEGYLLSPSKGASPRHKWAEFYTSRLGWVPVDPIYIEIGRTSFDTLKNMYVYSTRMRNDVILERHEFCVYRYYGASIRVEDPIVIHKNEMTDCDSMD